MGAIFIVDIQLGPTTSFDVYDRIQDAGLVSRSGVCRGFVGSSFDGAYVCSGSGGGRHVWLSEGYGFTWVVGCMMGWGGVSKVRKWLLNAVFGYVLHFSGIFGLECAVCGVVLASQKPGLTGCGCVYWGHFRGGLESLVYFCEQPCFFLLT